MTLQRALLPLAIVLMACTEPITETTVELPTTYVDFDVGAEHSCAVTEAAQVYCWGSNAHAQLGDSTTQSSAVPVQVRTTAALVAVSGGARHTCALAPDGGVYCWGANDRGQLGTGDRTARATPTRVQSEERFAEVSAGESHSCALTTDRRIYCWGAGDHGGTGTPEVDDVLTPQEIDTPIRFVQVSAGGTHTCAIDTGGLGHCWGKNDRGQLGDASFLDRRAPVRQVYGDETYRQISAGFAHACAIRTDNMPFCWGSNVHGELGEGVQPIPDGGVVTPYPVRLTGAARDIVAGYHSSCLVDTSAGSWCWGSGSDGQLGNGSRFDYAVPARVNGADLTSSILVFQKLSLGLHHACGLSNVQTVWCWGRGDHGQLGAGTFLYSTLPVRVLAGIQRGS